MISRVHHVAAVCPTIEDGVAVWRDRYGLEVEVEATVPAQGVRAVLLPCGDGEIELLEPLDPDGAIARFAQRGGGVHHVCFECESCAAELRRLKDLGVRLIDETPRPGLAGQIGFVHPKGTHGTLVEFATPGDGVETKPYADPHPTDPAFQVTGWLGVTWAVENVDSAVRTFADQYELREVTARYSLPELGGEGALVMLPNAAVQVVAPRGEGAVADRLRDKGEGAVALALTAPSVQPGIERLAAEGIAVEKSQGMDGEAVWIVPPEASQGVVVTLRELT